MTTYLIILLALGLATGYIGRWVQEYRYMRSRKRALESEYKRKVEEVVYHVNNLFEKEGDELQKMSRRDRLRYIAKRVG